MTSGVTMDGTALVVGYGTIARAAVPILVDLLGLPLDRFRVLDKVDCGDLLARERAAGLRFDQCEIVADTMDAELSARLEPGDLLINLSVGIDSIAMADWCHQHGVVYVDTAIEPWEGYVDDSEKPAAERTEYAFHQRARNLAATGWRANGPTAVVTHGANPGLVSHFAKAALLEVATAVGHSAEVPSTRREWAALSAALDVKVIHISERDTQLSNVPKRPGEFVNTWSIPGFVEEAMMPVELGWGSHERLLPPGARHHTVGPRNAIYLERAAGQFLMHSWVPLGGQILGLALPHSESVTISDYLTLERDGGSTYRPTVAFVYLPCDGAMSSLHETIMGGWQMPPSERILLDEITAGRDELGVLVLGHKKTGWWYGSQLSIDETRRLVPGTNPTALQVAAGVVAAAVWARRNPARGYCEPEDLPHQEILDLARPYLGPMASQATDWTPLKQRKHLFGQAGLVSDDPWQFANFMV